MLRLRSAWQVVKALFNFALSARCFVWYLSVYIRVHLWLIFLFSAKLCGCWNRLFLHFFAIKETKQRKCPSYLRISSQKLEIGRKTKCVLLISLFHLVLGTAITGGRVLQPSLHRHSREGGIHPFYFFVLFVVQLIVTLSEVEGSMRCLDCARHDKSKGALRNFRGGENKTYAGLMICEKKKPSCVVLGNKRCVLCTPWKPFTTASFSWGWMEQTA